MKKIKYILPLIISSFTLISCKTTIQTPGLEGEDKIVKGTGLLFSEPLGYNSKNGTIFEENNERYIVYVTNETKFENDNVFAIRKGQLNEGKWTYGDRKIILKPGSNRDKNIDNPTIIKGSYKLNNETYKYLMAYNGNNTSNNTINQIGLAVSNNLMDEWVKVGDNPVVNYDASIFGTEYGCGNPELVSFDKEGKAHLFYSYAEKELSTTVVKDCDFSNLNDIKIDEGYRALTVKGLIDDSDITIYSNAGFALSNDKTTIFTTRDVYPLSANKPNCSSKIEVAKANSNLLNTISSEGWTSIKKISGLDTIDQDDETSLGWDQLYSSTFVRDSYGYVDLNNNKLEILYSTFNEQESPTDTTYAYSAQLCTYMVNL